MTATDTRQYMLNRRAQWIIALLGVINVAGFLVYAIEVIFSPIGMIVFGTGAIAGGGLLFVVGLVIPVIGSALLVFGLTIAGLGGVGLILGLISAAKHGLLAGASVRGASTIVREAVGGGPGSSLRTSSEGLVYRVWPFFTIEGRWEDIDRLVRKQVLGIPSDTLYLKQARSTGFLRPGFISGTARARVGASRITLGGLDGWPDGDLAEEIRRRRPDLFAGSR